MTVECPSCNSSFPVDPKKVPAGGVHARCSVCDGVFFVADPGLEAEQAPQGVAVETPVEGPEAPEAQEFSETLPTALEGQEEFEPDAPVEEYSEPAFETHDSFSEEPEVPEDSLEETFEAPAGPAFEAPAGPAFEAPAEPAFDASLEPAFETHDTFSEEPEGPEDSIAETFEAPAEEPLPTFEAQEEPDFAEPSQGFDESAFQAPSFGEPEPTFDMGSPDLASPVEETPEPALHEPTPPASEEPATSYFAGPDAPTLEEPVEEAPAFQPPAPPTPMPLPTPQFGRRDPKEKAQRLARVLVSDIILYNPDRHQRALDEGRIKAEFDDEIQKSWAEYVDQVGEEIANSTNFFNEALNEILARGEEMF